MKSTRYQRKVKTFQSRDVSGKGVQQALLKISEGTTAAIPPKAEENIPNKGVIDTKIFYLFVESFNGLETIQKN